MPEGFGLLLSQNKQTEDNTVACKKLWMQFTINQWVWKIISRSMADEKWYLVQL